MLKQLNSETVHEKSQDFTETQNEFIQHVYIRENLN